MDDYLTKPFSPEEIDKMVRKWLPADSAPEDETLLDRERLSALDDGTPQGKENTRRLVEIFLESGRESLARIRAEHEAGDAQALARSLHRMKGGCATLGAVALTERIQAMEAALKAEGAGALGEDVGKLADLFARTEQALNRLPARSQP
jgi:two-component system, sensor histidine kinase and response regulator